LALNMFCQADGAKAQDVQAPRVAARVELAELQDKGGRVTLDAGSGVELQLTRNEGRLRDFQKVTVLDRGRVVRVLPQKDRHSFLSYIRLEGTPAIYWIVTEYSGGAHCCLAMHFFSRPAPEDQVRYLGRTAYRDGDSLPLDFHVVKGGVYLEDFDTRFMYFYTSGATSGAFDVPNFYHLTPTSLRLDNEPFKERYLKEAAKTEKRILEEQKKRTPTFSGQSPTTPGPKPETAKPEAILSADDIVDDLGLLLIRRTILLLYAREDRQAWESLARDLDHYYQTRGGLNKLKRGLQSRLNERPY
jgi:hypothetical protein